MRGFGLRAACMKKTRATLEGVQRYVFSHTVLTKHSRVRTLDGELMSNHCCSTYESERSSHGGTERDVLFCAAGGRTGRKKKRERDTLIEEATACSLFADDASVTLQR